MQLKTENGDYDLKLSTTIVLNLEGRGRCVLGGGNSGGGGQSPRGLADWTRPGNRPSVGSRKSVGQRGRDRIRKKVGGPSARSPPPHTHTGWFDVSFGGGGASNKRPLSSSPPPLTPSQCMTSTNLTTLGWWTRRCSRSSRDRNSISAEDTVGVPPPNSTPLIEHTPARGRNE